MNDMVRSTKRVNSITRKNNDPSREIIVDGRTLENVIYDLLVIKSIEEIDPVEKRLAKAHTVTARYKGWNNVTLGIYTNLT